MNRDDIYRLIDDERTRQAGKWAEPHAWGKGDCSSRAVPSIVKVAVLTEEVGEVARAVLDVEVDREHLRAELVQVAAVAVAWMESLP